MVHRSKYPYHSVLGLGSWLQGWLPGGTSRGPPGRGSTERQTEDQTFRATPGRLNLTSCPLVPLPQGTCHCYPEGIWAGCWGAATSPWDSTVPAVPNAGAESMESLAWDSGHLAVTTMSPAPTPLHPRRGRPLPRRVELPPRLGAALVRQGLQEDTSSTCH